MTLIDREALATAIYEHVWGADYPRDEAECCADALAPVVADMLAKARAEGGDWHAEHERLCSTGKFCSAHKPGFWPPLIRLGEQAIRERVEAACAKSEALTQDAIGHRSDHWRGPDYADGLDAGIEVTTGLIRAALRDEDGAA